MNKSVANTLLRDIEQLLYNQEERVNVNLILAKMYYLLELMNR